MPKPSTAGATELHDYPHAITVYHPNREQPWSVWRIRTSGDWVLTKFFSDEERRQVITEALLGPMW